MNSEHQHPSIIMKSGCTIEYDHGTIVLSGVPGAVYGEACKIMRGSAHSARPYEVTDEMPGRIVLRRLPPVARPRSAIRKRRPLTKKGVKE
ncbi:MAG: hypothetical protein OEQ18_01895 [Gammaproteobacteria bacterium]|nr:hypothetical protein [Gammaproteobacteria bacterium]